MHELTFVGLSDDGSGVVLSDADGATYSVTIDERLAASVRSGRPRPGRHASGEPLSPREVQARIRGGATSEEVAEEAGWDVERVRRFEGPPLAERAWVAEQAQSVEVRRPEGDARLEALVAERLETRGVGGDDLRWDSWRRDDGRWTILLAYPAGQGDRVATWIFEPAGRTLVADDDEARWLMEEPAPEPEPEPEDRPRLVGLPSVAPADEGRHDTIPVVRPIPAEVVTVQESVEVVVTEVTGAPEPEPAPAPTQPPADGGRGRSRRAKRASVPSWDEILFGAAERDE